MTLVKQWPNAGASTAGKPIETLDWLEPAGRELSGQIFIMTDLLAHAAGPKMENFTFPSNAGFIGGGASFGAFSSLADYYQTAKAEPGYNLIASATVMVIKHSSASVTVASRWPQAMVNKNLSMLLNAHMFDWNFIEYGEEPKTPRSSAAETSTPDSIPYTAAVHELRSLFDAVVEIEAIFLDNTKGDATVFVVIRDRNPILQSQIHKAESGFLEKFESIQPRFVVVYRGDKNIQTLLPTSAVPVAPPRT